MSGKKLKTKLEPGIGRLPIPAYQGDEPYIFVSYAHKDHDRVFTEIKRFNDAGYHVWYDEGITPGNEWTDEIASALSKCSLFIVFLTKNSVKSSNVADEINYVIDEHIPAIAIYLEECELQGGLKLRFQRKQAIMKYQMPEEEYIYKYRKAFDRILEREPEPDKPVDIRLPDKKKEKTTGNTSSNKKTVKIAVIAAAAVLVVAGIIIGIVAGASGSKAPGDNGGSQSAASSSGTSSDTSSVISAAYGEEDFADLLSAEPTPLSSFTINEENAVTSFTGDEEIVVIPDSVKEIDTAAFKGANIKGVVIPSSVSSVWAQAFEDCFALEKVYIADGVTDFGGELFKNCVSLEKIRLPQTLNKLAWGVFDGCIALKSITIPDTYTEIPSLWFINSGLETITFGKNVRTIKESAFENCTWLTSIEIPGSVTEIYYDAFKGSNALKSITLNEGLTEINQDAFYGCPLESITIPRSVTTMSSYAFEGCGVLLSEKGVKIYVHKGSYAEEYVKRENEENNQNLNYEVID